MCSDGNEHFMRLTCVDWNAKIPQNFSMKEDGDGKNNSLKVQQKDFKVFHIGDGDVVGAATLHVHHLIDSPSIAIFNVVVVREQQKSSAQSFSTVREQSRLNSAYSTHHSNRIVCCNVAMVWVFFFSSSLHQCTSFSESWESHLVAAVVLAVFCFCIFHSLV